MPPSGAPTGRGIAFAIRDRQERRQGRSLTMYSYNVLPETETAATAETVLGLGVSA